MLIVNSVFFHWLKKRWKQQLKQTLKMADNDDLLDYEDEEQTEQVVAETTEAPKKDVKGTYVSIHSSGFRDFLLKPEILRAIADCGFEHPSEGKPIQRNSQLA